MGLDMHLYKKTYVKNWEHMSEKEKHQVIVTKNGEPVKNIKPERVAFIVEEVGYWRKANAIHKWFVDNIQKGEDDCKEYYVEWGYFEKLIDLCKQVLENHDLADELLPSQSGFFFGSTDYNEYYFKDLEHTVEIYDELFKETLVSGRTGETYLDGYLYYNSSW